MDETDDKFGVQVTEVELNSPPATPETVLAKQAALNTRVASLKKWILTNVDNSKKRAEGIADLEQAHAELAKAIMEELGV